MEDRNAVEGAMEVPETDHRSFAGTFARWVTASSNPRSKDAKQPAERHGSASAWVSLPAVPRHHD